jgi:hypothetical protein
VSWFRGWDGTIGGLCIKSIGSCVEFCCVIGVAGDKGVIQDKGATREARGELRLGSTAVGNRLELLCKAKSEGAMIPERRCDGTMRFELNIGERGDGMFENPGGVKGDDENDGARKGGSVAECWKWIFDDDDDGRGVNIDKGCAGDVRPTCSRMPDGVEVGAQRNRFEAGVEDSEVDLGAGEISAIGRLVDVFEAVRLGAACSGAMLRLLR